MKPTKNRVFCRDCNKTKMLFETEKKANNFIAFNKEEIEAESGYAPERSYFCLFCGGWHVTSIIGKIGMSKNEKIFENYLKDKIEKPQEIVPDIIKENIIEKQNDILSEIENEIKEMNIHQMEVFFSEKITLISKEIEDLNDPTNTIDKEKIKTSERTSDGICC